MLIAFNGRSDAGDRLGAILGRTSSVHRLAAGHPIPDTSDGVVVFDHLASLDELMALHAGCARRQLPWTLVIDRGRHVQVGPLFAPWLVPLCPRCVMIDAAGFAVAHAGLSGAHGCRTCRPGAASPPPPPFIHDLKAAMGGVA
jgi:hypothetical protein